MNKKILDKVLTLRLAFLLFQPGIHRLLSLLSALIPSSFSQLQFSMFIFPISRFILLCLFVIRPYLSLFAYTPLI